MSGEVVVKEQLKRRDEEPGASLTVTDVAKKKGETAALFSGLQQKKKKSHAVELLMAQSKGFSSHGLLSTFEVANCIPDEMLE